MAHHISISNYPVVPATEVPLPADQLPVCSPRRVLRGATAGAGDASLAETVISTRKFDKLLAFDASAGVLHCQAGVLLADLLDVFVPRAGFCR